MLDWQLVGLLLLGFASGLLNGVAGTGAGVLIVPVLVLLGFTAVDTASSVAVAMCAITACLQVIPYYVRNWRSSDWIAALILLVVGLATGHLGVRFSDALPQYAANLMLSFVAVLNLDLFIRYERKRKKARKEISVDTDPRSNLFKYIGFGSVAAIFGGMVGSAGGLILFPLLVSYTGMRIKQAVPACLVMMAGSSVSAIFGQLEYGQLDMTLGIPLGIGAVVGSFFGVIAIKHVSDEAISLLVKLFLSEVGIFLLIWSLFG